MSISPGYIPHDNINPHLLEQFFGYGHAITQEHLDASKFNTELLKKHTDRIVIHFRDPRSVMISWTHHMNDLNNKKQYNLLKYVTPTPPRGYYLWDFEKQLDWQINNFLPYIVQWMNEWLEFKAREEANNSKFKVLITTYEDFLNDELEFYYKILDFYNIPRSDFRFNPPPKNGSTHFRNGTVDEWKSILTMQQLQRIDKIIPDKLLERFNWSKTIDSPASTIIFSRQEPSSITMNTDSNLLNSNSLKPG